MKRCTHPASCSDSKHGKIDRPVTRVFTGFLFLAVLSGAFMANPAFAWQGKAIMESKNDSLEAVLRGAPGKPGNNPANESEALMGPRIFALILGASKANDRLIGSFNFRLEISGLEKVAAEIREKTGHNVGVYSVAETNGWRTHDISIAGGRKLTGVGVPSIGEPANLRRDPIFRAKFRERKGLLSVPEDMSTKLCHDTAMAIIRKIGGIKTDNRCPDCLQPRPIGKEHQCSRPGAAPIRSNKGQAKVWLICNYDITGNKPANGSKTRRGAVPRSMAYSKTNSRGQTYYLHSKEVQLRGSGRTQTIYYFAKEVKAGALNDIPAGKTIVENERTGLLFLKGNSLSEGEEVCTTCKRDRGAYPLPWFFNSFNTESVENSSALSAATPARSFITLIVLGIGPISRGDMLQAAEKIREKTGCEVVVVRKDKDSSSKLHPTRMTVQGVLTDTGGPVAIRKIGSIDTDNRCPDCLQPRSSGKKHKGSRPVDTRNLKRGRGSIYHRGFSELRNQRK